MRKYIATSLLIVSMTAGTLFNGGIPTNETYAKAATVRIQKLTKPNGITAKKNSNGTEVCFNKVKGATEYKVYRANSKNGTYKCIGTTTNDEFQDKLNNSKNCYYKVKACKNGKELSGFSNSAKVSSPSTKSKTAANSKTTTSPKATTPSVSNGQFNQSYADEVLKLVNQERAKAGLKALTTNESLQNAANKRAQEIVNSFSHTRPDGRSFSTVLAEYNVSYRASGENIAAGQKTPSEVVNAWMNSSGHRANILGSQFGKVGMGVLKGNDGKYYWTQVFTN